MRTKSTKVILVTLFVAFALSICAFALTGKVQRNVYANNSTPIFVFEDGASIKLVDNSHEENGTNGGFRFRLLMDEDTATEIKSNVNETLYIFVGSAKYMDAVENNDFDSLRSCATKYAWKVTIDKDKIYAGATVDGKTQDEYGSKYYFANVLLDINDIAKYYKTEFKVVAALYDSTANEGNGGYTKYSELSVSRSLYYLTNYFLLNGFSDEVMDVYSWLGNSDAYKISITTQEDYDKLCDLLENSEVDCTSKYICLYDVEDTNNLAQNYVNISTKETTTTFEQEEYFMQDGAFEYNLSESEFVSVIGVKIDGVDKTYTFSNNNLTIPADQFFGNIQTVSILGKNADGIEISATLPVYAINYAVRSIADYKGITAEINSKGNTYEGKVIALDADLYASGATLLTEPSNNAVVNFNGTFDGRGHTIFDANFGFRMFRNSYKATFKNVSIINATIPSFYGGVFFTDYEGSGVVTFENIYIHAKSLANRNGDNGVLARSLHSSTILNNVVVKVDSTEKTSILSGSAPASNTGVPTSSKNVFVYAPSATALYAGNTTSITGLYTSESDFNAITKAGWVAQQDYFMQDGAFTYTLSDVTAITSLKIDGVAKDYAFDNNTLTINANQFIGNLQYVTIIAETASGSKSIIIPVYAINYVIRTVADYKNMGSVVTTTDDYSGKVIALGADLVVNGIIMSGAAGRSFNGTFDGRGYIIYGAELGSTSDYRMFQQSYKGTFKNVSFVNTKIGSFYGGLFFADDNGGTGTITFENIYVHAKSLANRNGDNGVLARSLKATTVVKNVVVKVDSTEKISILSGAGAVPSVSKNVIVYAPSATALYAGNTTSITGLYTTESEFNTAITNAGLISKQDYFMQDGAFTYTLKGITSVASVKIDGVEKAYTFNNNTLTINANQFFGDLQFVSVVGKVGETTKTIIIPVYAINYVIRTVADYNNIGTVLTAEGNNYVGKVIAFDADLKLNGATLSTGATGVSFNGTFDGRGHAIYDATFSTRGFLYSYSGIFKNIAYVNATIGSFYGGLFFAENYKAGETGTGSVVIENVYVHAKSLGNNGASNGVFSLSLMAGASVRNVVVKVDSTEKTSVLAGSGAGPAYKNVFVYSPKSTSLVGGNGTTGLYNSESSFNSALLAASNNFSKDYWAVTGGSVAWKNLA